MFLFQFTKKEKGRGKTLSTYLFMAAVLVVHVLLGLLRDFVVVLDLGIPAAVLLVVDRRCLYNLQEIF
jgi:hypothetical protein